MAQRIAAALEAYRAHVLEVIRESMRGVEEFVAANEVALTSMQSKLGELDRLLSVMSETRAAERSRVIDMPGPLTIRPKVN